MIIHGREIKFLRTVKANCDIANICPNGDVKNIDKLFDGKYQHSQEQSAKFMAILSDGYEQSRKYEDPGYKPNPLTVDEVMCLTDEEFGALFSEAVSVFAGEQPTIQTKPASTGKKKGSAK